MSFDADSQFFAALYQFTGAFNTAKKGSAEHQIAVGLANLNLGTQTALKQILKELEALKAKIK